MNYLDALRKNIPRPVKIAVFVVLMSFVVVVIAAIIINNRPELKSDSLVRVEDFDDKTESLPTAYQDVVESSIEKIIRMNDELSTISYSDAVVRENSYEESEVDNTMKANFIIDIDSLHYSFAVSVSWPKNKKSTKDPNVVITCPHYLDVIYTDKKCIAESPEQQLKRYLPHYARVENVKYAVNFKQEINSSYLRIEIPACDSSDLIEAAKDDVKKWIKTLYLDPNDYEIGAINTCTR